MGGQPQKKTVVTSKGRNKAKYAKQFDRTYRNKEKAWKKHIKKYPNDAAAKEQIRASRESMRKFG